MIFNIILVLFAVPTLLTLHSIHIEARNRRIHATAELVTTGLIRERKEQELKIYSESFQRRLNAIRSCEKNIYGYFPNSEYPEQLKTKVSPQQAQERISEFLKVYEKEEKRFEDQQRELEIRLADKRQHIQEINRRFRRVDRVFDISALVLRAALVLAILYSLTSLLFGLIP